MTRREFHYRDEQSDKFWAIALTGNTYRVHFGRQGTAGQEQTKEFASLEAATVAYEKAIAEKLKKGYVEVQATDFLQDALDRIERSLGQQSPDAVALLQPGLSRDAIDKVLVSFPFRLSEEAYQLYQWHNGTDLNHPFGLMPCYLFLPLEECLQEYQQTLEIYQNLDGVGDWKDLYHPSWFPIFCDEGNYYVTPGEATAQPAAPVLDKFSEEPEVRVLFDNLTQMMQAIADCWEAGIYQVTEIDGPAHYVEGDDLEANRIWLTYQSQRAVNVDALLAQQTDSLTPEQQLSAYNDLVATEHPEALTILRQALQDTCETNVELCCQIIYCLGRLRSPAAAETLLPLVTHPELKVHMAAVSSLVWTVGEAALRQVPDLNAMVEPLVQPLLQGSDYLLGGRDRVMLLGMIGDRRACAPLISLLETVPQDDFLESDLKFSILKALCKLQDPAAIEPIHQRAMEDANPLVRLSAGRALRAMGDDRGIAVIHQMAQADLPSFSQVAQRVLTLAPDEFLRQG